MHHGICRAGLPLSMQWLYRMANTVQHLSLRKMSTRWLYHLTLPRQMFVTYHMLRSLRVEFSDSMLTMCNRADVAVVATESALLWNFVQLHNGGSLRDLSLICPTLCRWATSISFTQFRLDRLCLSLPRLHGRDWCKLLDQLMNTNMYRPKALELTCNWDILHYNSTCDMFGRWVSEQQIQNLSITLQRKTPPISRGIYYDHGLHLFLKGVQGSLNVHVHLNLPADIVTVCEALKPNVNPRIRKLHLVLSDQMRGWQGILFETICNASGPIDIWFAQGIKGRGVGSDATTRSHTLTMDLVQSGTAPDWSNTIFEIPKVHHDGAILHTVEATICRPHHAILLQRIFSIPNVSRHVQRVHVNIDASLNIINFCQGLRGCYLHTLSIRPHRTLCTQQFGDSLSLLNGCVRHTVRLDLRKFGVGAIHMLLFNSDGQATHLPRVFWQRFILLVSHHISEELITRLRNRFDISSSALFVLVCNVANVDGDVWHGTGRLSD